ncbi:hypothetical protein E3N88_32668 [Mikania micrantha]|uniref:Uncharacterized protein n=1 Tax=Mikania micrantha TaxID=192012 RepID=A0A5N6MBQ0_9ASTR|nr:hypothetical protein E3N88_32668 [Mikania micrantha]
MKNQLLNSNLKGSEASAQERSTKRCLGIDRKCNGEIRQNATGSASTIKIKWKASFQNNELHICKESRDFDIKFKKFKDWVAKSTMSTKAAVGDTAMDAVVDSSNEISIYEIESAKNYQIVVSSDL